MATSKKVTRAGGGSAPQKTARFVPTAEAKAQAKKLRVFAVLFWVLAIAAQIAAIYVLLNMVQPVREITVAAPAAEAVIVDGEAPDGALSARQEAQARSSRAMTLIILFIILDLIFVVLGSVLFWKKANRLDPASEKDKVRFFLQNQLGVIMAILAFLPLIILILTNKDLDDKQKGILGAVAGVALLVAGYFGIDFNPPSIEQYTAEIERMEELTGGNDVFWTRTGVRYHIYQDCGSINTERTTSIFSGPLQYAYAGNTSITGLCGHCNNKAERLKRLAEQAAPPPLPEIMSLLPCYAN
jgi:hypothetical protein